MKRDAENEEVWNWINGDILEDDSLWLHGEPNNSGTNEDCVTLKNGGLNDFPCSRKKKGLCEMKMETENFPIP